MPWDGTSRGELQAAGPWIASSYYNDERTAESFTADGWLKTGDVCTVDASGYMRIVDRTKDVVKSGGEWISSVELENEIMAHPEVAEAAVIGVKHPKWSERPMACVVVRPGEELTKEELLEFLERPRGQVVAARRRGLHRGDPQDLGGQVLQEGPARPVRRPQAPRHLTRPVPRAGSERVGNRTS